MKYITNKSLFEKYRNYKQDDFDFNVASLARPSQDVFNRVFSSENISVEYARQKAAQLTNANPNYTLFGRNGTEAMRYAVAIEKPKKVLLYGVENYSTRRNFEFFGDFGNTDKTDFHSTFADKGFEEAHVNLAVNAKKDVEVLLLKNYERLLEHSLTADIVVFPHISQTGNIYDVEKISKDIRKKSSAKILIDGCQSLANIKKIDLKNFFSKGVDYYVTVAHKHLGAHPLGICYANSKTVKILNLQNVLAAEQIIMEGMISKIFRVKPNVPYKLNNNRLKSLVYTIEELENKKLLTGNNFSEKVSLINPLMKELKRVFKNYRVQQESPAILGVFDISEKTKERFIKNRFFFSQFGNKTRFSISEKTEKEGIKVLKRLLC